VIDADLEDYGLAPAFLMGLDLRALCKEEETRIVHEFLEKMNEENPAWMAFVRARRVGDHVQEEPGSWWLNGRDGHRSTQEVESKNRAKRTLSALARATISRTQSAGGKKLRKEQVAKS